MENHNTHNSIKEAVLAKIKSGQAKMKPRWHFVLQGALIAVGAVIIALTLLYLLSFVIFVLHRNGTWFVPSFGLRGIQEFLFALPWMLILAMAIFVGLLELLVRHYSFGYKKPLLYSLLVIIGFVVLGGGAISLTGLHRGLLHFSENNMVPFAQDFYRGFDEQNLDHIYSGVVGEITAGGMNITTRRGNDLQVVVSSETSFPNGLDLKVGDRVVVVGEMSASTTVQADGIRRIENDPDMPRPRRGFPPPFPDIQPL